MAAYPIVHRLACPVAEPVKFAIARQGGPQNSGGASCETKAQLIGRFFHPEAADLGALDVETVDDLNAPDGK